MDCCTSNRAASGLKYFKLNHIENFGKVSLKPIFQIFCNGHVFTAPIQGLRNSARLPKMVLGAGGSSYNG